MALIKEFEELRGTRGLGDSPILRCWELVVISDIVLATEPSRCRAIDGFASWEEEVVLSGEGDGKEV